MHLILESRRFSVKQTSQKVEGLIRDCGFAHANAGISSLKFPPPPRSEGVLTMATLTIPDGLEATTALVLDWMRANKFRPATVHEMLALVSQFPTLCLTQNVHALGSLRTNNGGASEVVGCSLRRQRVLRFYEIQWEPWWAAAEDSFLCVVS
jgi:hypothetical protein